MTTAKKDEQQAATSDFDIIMAEKNIQNDEINMEMLMLLRLLSGPGDKWRLIEDEEMNNMKRAHTNDARAVHEHFGEKQITNRKKKKKTTEQQQQQYRIKKNIRSSR